MRPKDLKSDYTWKDRKPYIKDLVLYVPEYYFEHQLFIIPSFASIFGEEREVVIEFCSGNGDWIVEKAKAHPEKIFVAVEMLFERVRKIYAKRENQQIKNLLIVCGEALTFCKYYLAQGSVDDVFVNFPDPWPKLRHAKHRLLKEDFLQELQRILKKGGSLTFTSDDENYALSTLDLLQKNLGWKSVYPDPFFVTDLSDYGFSFFYSLWRSKGKTIRHLQFKTC